MEAIQLDIERIYRECDVREVDFIPTLSPPLVVFEQGVLGVSMSALKPLYQRVFQQVMDILKELRGCDSSESERVLLEAGMRSTQLALTVKGDLAVAFSLRKRFLRRSQSLELFSREVRFLSAVFSRHPKSPSGWEHRRWCLRQTRQMQQQQQQRPTLMPAEVETEKELCRVMADKYLRNYYAWMHRLWLLQFMTDHQIENELYFIREWLTSHVSDYSAVNHGMQVAQMIVSERPHIIDAIVRETSLNTTVLPCHCKLISFMLNMSGELIVSRPGSASLWSFRRGLVGLALADRESDTPQPVSTDSENELKDIFSRLKERLTNSNPVSEETAMFSEHRNEFEYVSEKDFMFIIVSEAKFILSCIDRQPSWGRDKQLQQAVRHLRFLFEKFSQFHAGKELESFISFILSSER